MYEAQESPSVLGGESPYRHVLDGRQRLIWRGGVSQLVLDDCLGDDAVSLDLGDFDARVRRSANETRVEPVGSFWSRALDALIYGFGTDEPSRVGLHREATWDVEISGGVSELEGRLQDVSLASLSIRGGVSSSRLALGSPRGTGRIQITGGVSHLEITRPAAVGLRLWARGGVSRLVLDDMELEGVGGKLALTSVGCESADAIYDLEIRGGASDLLLTTR